MKELVVNLPNKPGQVYEISSLLGKNKVNMLAVAVIAQGETADFHVLVDDSDRGQKLLGDNGYNVKAGEVLQLELLHSPGELSRITKLLADADVNILLLYGSGAKGPEAQLVLGVDKLDKAKAALDMD